jgi:putative NADPH-quinone reductase
MTASLILAHPYPGSFNHALFSRARDRLSALGAVCHAHDLYAEGFDPVLTVAELGSGVSDDPLVVQYTDELLASELLVLVHPNWWGQPPAMMKGYIDRVFRMPHAYEVLPDGRGGTLPEGRLGGKRAIVFTTSNTPAGREKEYFGDPLASIWGPCIFGFCGVDAWQRVNFSVVEASDDATRKRWLDEVDGLMEAAAPG